MSMTRAYKARATFIAAFCALAVAVVMAMSMTATAKGAATYYFGNATTNVFWPYCTSTCLPTMSSGTYAIWETSARTTNGETVCTTAFSTTGVQVGSVACSSTLAVKSDFCGCEYRFGGSRGTLNNARPYGRAQLQYY